MNVKMDMARIAGAASEWGLKHVFHRPGANFPGKLGLYVDPQLIADLRPRIRQGCVAVCGTNGKTTVTNMLADVLEASGCTVACNRTGANLDSGVASALLDAQNADWGVFECDELWLGRIAPQLEPDYLVLLNLFRDQLDRMGEIALLQQAIADALRQSPGTALVYNCDDPLCQAIADCVDNPRIPFSIAVDMGLPQKTVSDAGMCPHCNTLLEYGWHQYGQLGSYQCPRCGFTADQPAYTADRVHPYAGGLRIALRGGTLDLLVDAPFSGAYMAYNILAVYAAADCCGASFMAFESAVHDFNPRNGRQQRYRVADTNVLLNLAKNPIGFNQNIDLIRADAGPKAVAFFVNDHEADGHDVSWLWDIDFQALCWASDLAVYAGGLRRNDVQVRLKHAGINAQLIDNVHDFLSYAHAACPEANCYVIANYTALPAVKEELDELEGSEAAALPHPNILSAAERAADSALPDAHADFALDEKLKIVHLYPTLLNLYGDGGNVTILANRARWHGICTEVSRVDPGDELDLADADIVFLGGGPDREQRMAAHELAAYADKLAQFVEDDGVLLAICGGYQILGREWLMGDETVAGLGLLDIATTRAKGNARNRLVGNIALESPLASLPVLGYENHAGRTHLGKGCVPFGTVTGRLGHGNNDTDKADGAIYRNVVGTYLHGPLLAKNPEVADWLIARAVERRAAKEGRPAPALSHLDDSVEHAANEQVRKHLGLR